MSADTRTALYRTPAEVLELFLSALRERHARGADIPIPVPAKPIALELEPV